MDKPLFKLKVYEGPLDLLLDMIKNSKVDIFDIDIFEISEQFFLYIKTMKEMNMDLTADFLVMASQLLLIKSRMLLPRAEPEEEDPRRDLTWALLEYERCKENAAALAELKNRAGETFSKPPENLVFPKKYRETMPQSSIVNAYARVLLKNARRTPPRPDDFSEILKREIYSVADKITEISKRLKMAVKLDFITLFSRVRTRSEIVATFLAVLELVSDKKIKVTDAGNMNYEIEAIDGPA
ncbi:MAG: segregation/condensation protein A [Clostridia bacterium]|nr:segregation/condensation protein A [Clostridia bacterium]